MLTTVTFDDKLGAIFTEVQNLMTAYDHRQHVCESFGPLHLRQHPIETRAVTAISAAMSINPCPAQTLVCHRASRSSWDIAVEYLYRW